jgi:recombination protein RecA
LITKRGSFYSYGETRLGQGRENAKDFLRENPDMAAEIEAGIRADVESDQDTDDDEDVGTGLPEQAMIEAKDNGR